MNQNTFSRVKNVVQSVFADHEGEILPNFSSRDITGWDSLGHINFVIALESEFGVRLRPAKLARLADLEQIVVHIDSNL